MHGHRRWSLLVGRALHVMLFLKNLIQVLWIFNG
jgi:hypothetical protein